jgi:hypothetical protein
MVYNLGDFRLTHQSCRTVTPITANMVATRRSRTHINVTHACVLPIAPPALMADSMQATEGRVLYRLLNIAATSAEVIQI